MTDEQLAEFFKGKSEGEILAIIESWQRTGGAVHTEHVTGLLPQPWTELHTAATVMMAAPVAGAAGGIALGTVSWTRPSSRRCEWDRCRVHVFGSSNSIKKRSEMAPSPGSLPEQHGGSLLFRSSSSRSNKTALTR